MSDFIFISEFNEYQGPTPVAVIPEHCSNCIDVAEFSLKLQEIDFQQILNKESLQIPLDFYCVVPYMSVVAYVHCFTLLDVNARGYFRCICMAYVTKEADKLFFNLFDLHSVFCNVINVFKDGNSIVFLRDLERRRTFFKEESYCELYNVISRRLLGVILHSVSLGGTLAVRLKQGRLEVEACLLPTLVGKVLTLPCLCSLSWTLGLSLLSLAITHFSTSVGLLFIEAEDKVNIYPYHSLLTVGKFVLINFLQKEKEFWRNNLNKYSSQYQSIIDGKKHFFQGESNHYAEAKRYPPLWSFYRGYSIYNERDSVTVRNGHLFGSSDFNMLRLTLDYGLSLGPIISAIIKSVPVVLCSSPKHRQKATLFVQALSLFISGSWDRGSIRVCSWFPFPLAKRDFFNFKLIVCPDTIPITKFIKNHALVVDFGVNLSLKNSVPSSKQSENWVTSKLLKGRHWPSSSSFLINIFAELYGLGELSLLKYYHDNLILKRAMRIFPNTVSIPSNNWLSSALRFAFSDLYTLSGSLVAEICGNTDSKFLSDRTVKETSVFDIISCLVRLDQVSSLNEFVFKNRLQDGVFF
eukprot:TRINITY_DN142_c0_g1_i1.p1 TRINITY_DN142_c0_g1~~TRINITY_DN142_c0_g1_i1.p1  ORF type:complete len:579 (+),score=13.12 TRINITY_DN142_c0_g1_i1:2-1738(+)